MKNKITKSCKSSRVFSWFMVLFVCLFQSIGQSRPDPDSKSDSFKDSPEVLLLQNVNFTLFNLVKNKLTKTCKSSYEFYCFLVVFWCLLHLINQSRPDIDSKSDSFKDSSEVLLLQNVNFTHYRGPRHRGKSWNRNCKNCMLGVSAQYFMFLSILNCCQKILTKNG